MKLELETKNEEWVEVFKGLILVDKLVRWSRN